MRALLFIVTLLSFTGLAYGADHCDSAMTQGQLNDCSARAYRDADAQLNTVYKHIMGRLDTQPDRAQHLKSAQRAWVKFRDAECQFVADRTAGGSIQPMVISACLGSLTRARTAQLDRYTQCNEGDVSCPLP
ncbi:lysozyme inhibitor LprI family protein [Pseudomonas sp.]|uniref:lysozyme inhibitor LprI family protein n=1 Tax=Pseudomonas sp. TaxID=306 RepID=UPI002625240E|nr:lysozyme inhibitor LprI family protein [Pseudomonas sp.]